MFHTDESELYASFCASVSIPKEGQHDAGGIICIYERIDRQFQSR